MDLDEFRLMLKHAKYSVPGLAAVAEAAYIATMARLGESSYTRAEFCCCDLDVHADVGVNGRAC